jgi:O-antigen ligase
VGAVAVVAVAVLALIAAGAHGRLNHAWAEFKRPTESSLHGTSRLGSTSGENRYQAWSSAVREFKHDPLTGTGANTFQLWWTRDGDVGDPILDAHSLYLQTLGELGIVGFALLLAFLLTALWGGGVRVLRAHGARRTALAAALAGSTAIWTSSVADWTWKIPVIPIAALLLIAVVVSAGDREAERPVSLPLAIRAGVVVLGLAALVAIAIPLASTSSIRDSQAAAREGDVATALGDARSAQNVQPGAATPRIQEALLLESEGEYAAAAAAALAATEREPTNWRTWLLLSRIEAQQGQPRAAIRDYRRARALNPHSVLFASS